MLSQRRAAQMWGISRGTLQRAITSGKMSVLADGAIDPSEMLRVFGEASSDPLRPSVGPLGPPPSHPNEIALQAEIKILRAALAAKDEIIAAKEQNLDDLRHALKLLEGPTTTRRRSLWAKLTGG